jgi:hypothetical protein
VLGLAFAFFFTIPFVLPLIIFVAPIAKPLCGVDIARLYGGRDGTDESRNSWLVVIGLLDCLQTIVIFPLAFVMVFNADDQTDLFIYLTVTLVFSR